MKPAVWLACAGLAFAQSTTVVVPDLATAKWEKDDSVLLHEDSKSGAMDLLVRYGEGAKGKTAAEIRPHTGGQLPASH